MPANSIYKDIALRTGGDIYIGVVGPVRSGKSTFVKKFMDSVVIPAISGDYEKERAKDELPQAASGKTVMTTEPKFIPDEAVKVSLPDGSEAKIRMIDCVGYMIPDVMGTTENGKLRMVKTPWSDAPMPFKEAAETGTRKVIRDHSTIGMLVTTDGTIGEIPRINYEEAERRVVKELKEIKKPFAVVINTADPQDPDSQKLAMTLEKEYGAPTALVNCLELDKTDIEGILSMILEEFPVKTIDIEYPEWISALPENYWFNKEIKAAVKEAAEKIAKTGEIASAFEKLGENKYIESAAMVFADMGTGSASVKITPEKNLFYKVIEELTGNKIEGEKELMDLLINLSEVKDEYSRFENAIKDANDKGYGIVMPEISELQLEEPEIMKQSGAYGVKLRASARSIHMIKANIETEINPIVGSEARSEELVTYLLKEFEEAPQKIWESNLFGKSLYELVNEGLHTKLQNMPEESRTKLSNTLERIINEGSGGLICIIL